MVVTEIFPFSAVIIYTIELSWMHGIGIIPPIYAVSPVSEGGFGVCFGFFLLWVFFLGKHDSET